MGAVKYSSLSRWQVALHLFPASEGSEDLGSHSLPFRALVLSRRTRGDLYILMGLLATSLELFQVYQSIFLGFLKCTLVSALSSSGWTYKV